LGDGARRGGFQQYLPRLAASVVCPVLQVLCATLPHAARLPFLEKHPMNLSLSAVLAALALACCAQAQADVRYKFTTLPYNSVRNAATPCGGGICADLPAGQRVSGYFTTSAPLPPQPEPG